MPECQHYFDIVKGPTDESLPGSMLLLKFLHDVQSDIDIDVFAVVLISHGSKLCTKLTL